MVKVAILHEGNSQKTHDNELLKLLIENLGLNINKVEFFGMGYKSNFFDQENTKYKRLKLQIQEKEVNKVLFVIDADYVENDAIYGGVENTETKLQKTIDALGIAEHSTIYVTCDPSEQSGYLESLILSTIPDEQKECIETFLECSDFKSKENHKAILNQIYKTAYPNAPFDFSHQNFNELKQKLKNLFKEEN
jgi:tRNA nucleotidyltransferase (CCA-adding enzyme)